jgi:hypothetical protein
VDGAFHHQPMRVAVLVVHSTLPLGGGVETIGGVLGGQPTDAALLAALDVERSLIVIVPRLLVRLDPVGISARAGSATRTRVGTDCSFGNRSAWPCFRKVGVHSASLLLGSNSGSRSAIDTLRQPGRP